MQHLNNTVIKVLDEGHGEKVIKWWKSQGVETNLEGSANEKDDSIYFYYGFINNRFENYSLTEVQEANATIIELPIEGEIPILDKGVLMEVSDDENFRYPYKKFVFGKTKNFFLAWNDAETEDKIDFTDICIWAYARRIQETPEYTMEELVAKIGHNFKIKK